MGVDVDVEVVAVAVEGFTDVVVGVGVGIKVGVGVGGIGGGGSGNSTYDWKIRSILEISTYWKDYSMNSIVLIHNFRIDYFFDYVLSFWEIQQYITC